MLQTPPRDINGTVDCAVKLKLLSSRAVTVCLWCLPCPVSTTMNMLCRVGQIRRCAASLSQTISQVSAARQKHTLPDLTYDYGALEPHISAEIMQLHHSKHHATYVNNLNVTEEKYQEALAKGDVTTQVALQPALKFNGGGHINHTIFWTNLSPNGGGEPQGELMEAIKRDFGSFQKMKEKMSAATVAVQGSGWGWLGYDKESGRLRIAACANQDPLQGTTGQWKTTQTTNEYRPPLYIYAPHPTPPTVSS
uniref:Superoxide dismutase n=1 Tax=Lates calcarifer TaxID=8187 RepID=A0A4W6EQH3_LATCA